MKKLLMFLAAWSCLSGPLQAKNDPVTLEKMTPLVGRNCVINQIDKELVDVIGLESSLGNLVDTNVDNYASLSGLAGVDVAYHQIVSVKDVKYVYEGGQEAGFVIQSASEGTNLLTVDVLKLFVIETYLNGEKQEGSVYQEGESGLLDLNLITIASNGQTKVSIRTTKPFDEVRLAVSGVNVEAFKSLKLYYAYVGENPIHPITQTRFYPNASVLGHRLNGIGNEWTTAIWNWPDQKEKLVGIGSEDKGVGFGTLSSLLTEPRVTVDAGETIPANTEVGFLIESGSVLAINILNNTILTTYDASGEEVESKKIVSVLGLSAVSGSRTTVSMVTTKPCQSVKIQFGGLNVDVGGTKIFYAYTRDANIYVDTECDLKLSANASVCSQESYQLSGVDGIMWSIHSQPAGANATVSAKGLVEGMSKPGEYVIKAQKGNCEDFVTINNSPTSPISSECNRPIVGENIMPFSPPGGGCLLCLSPEYEDFGNVVDEDLTNYIEYTKGLDLLSNTSIYGVQKMDGIYPASESNPIRVGFIMQATDQFLTADVLKFFTIKTYLGEKLQESSPIDENDAVGANLIGGTSNQMRYSFVATKPFDKVSIWTAGVLSLNLSKYRIYYAFEEPASSDCMAQYTSGGCLSLLSSRQGATINYERSGFGGIANVGAFMRNLANLLDGDMTTFAYINKVAGVAANTTLSIKTDKVFEDGYQTGFVVEEQTWLGNVDLLRLLRVKTYLNGIATGDESIKPEVLSLDLIGSYGKSLVAITPTKPFDEIQLDMGGLVDALVELKVYGAFVQPDTDGDGIPDCMDKNPCGEELIPSTTGVYCVGDQVKVSFSGGNPQGDYTLQIGNASYPFTDGYVEFQAETSGQFKCDILMDGEEVYTNLPITIHPLETQWTGAISTDWNEWGNWTKGTPYICTNVIIPSVENLETGNGVNYPILEEGLSYYCNGIHFAPGAEVIRQDLLMYTKAWVELKVLPQRQYMVSIPLKETYAGDIFIGWDEDSTEVLPYESREPFTSLKGHVKRQNPSVTSRDWNVRWMVNATDKLLASGFTMLANNGTVFDSATPFIFRFGKEDLEYQRYTADGSFEDGTIRIDRDGANVGKFIWDKEGEIDKFPYRDTLNINSGKYFVVGNPFMAHLSVSKLIAKINENGGIVQPYVKVYDGNPDNSTVLPTRPMVTLDATDTNAKIAPMEAFFLESINNSTRQLIVPFTPDMMAHGDYSVAEPALPKARSAETNEAGISLVDIKAYAKNGEAVISSSETITKVEVVTIAGQVLLAKRPNSTECRMALGEGVNIVKVTTGNGTQNFKLVK